MTDDLDLSPIGLHAEPESEPEPDFSAKYEAQQERIDEDVPIKNNQGSSRGALQDVTKELSKATSPETRVKLADVQKKIGANVDKLLANLPAKIKKANLAETVGALTKLVPLMGEIDNLLTPRKSPQDLMDEIRKRAASKLNKKTNGKAAPTD